MLKLVTQEVEQPLIVFGIDNSESMVMTGDSTRVRRLVSQQLPKLEDALRGDFEVRTYAFGQAVQEAPSPQFTDQETNLSAFLDQVRDNYSNRNLGAIVIASDGLYNKGLNPIHQMQQFGSPVYTIAMGDTTRQRDVLIAEVVHNELAYLGNRFPIEVDLRSYGFDALSARVSVMHNGDAVATEVVPLNAGSDQNIVRFLIEATDIGMQRYTVRLDPIEGEFTTANNTRDIFIEVLDSKQKILLVENAPHPDIRAIRLAIEANDNYALELVNARDPLPPLDAYHLVILHELPSVKNPISSTIEKIKDAGLPAWFILGEQTDLNAFNAASTGLSITDTRPTLNTASAAFNPTFSLFNVDAETGNYFGTLPPLAVPFGEYQQTAQGQVLMNQRIGSVKTPFPLWSFAEQDKWKTAILSGTGVWRWRTMGYADRGTHDVFNRLIAQTVQYLASRENKQFLRVSGARGFRENEDIIFRAECYNPSYELYTDPSVQMVVTDSDGNNYEFNFSRVGNAYRLNAGHLPAGNYTYEVMAQTENKVLTAAGSFSVEDVNIESIALTANHRLLFQLANSTDGEMLSPEAFDTLGEKLRGSENIASVAYERKELSDLIHLKWIFFILLALFTVEWFIRKRNGAY